ncbi:SLAM family member 5-like [Stigmatopora nigra]
MKPGVFFTLILLLVPVAVGKDVHFAPGEALKLQPNISAGDIKSLEWSHNNNLFADWQGGRFHYYGTESVKARSSLDENAGVLRIADAGATDTGIYKLSINNVEQSEPFVAILVRRLKTPKVHLSPTKCSSLSKTCMLHCSVDQTGAEPVQYLWRDEPVKETRAGTNVLNISRADNRVVSFVCVVKNPLGSVESEPHVNPFYEDNSWSAGAVAGLVIGLLVLGVFLLMLCHYFKTVRQFFQRFCCSSVDKSEGESEMMNDPRSGNPAVT